jgi:Immunoglobulin domain
MHFATSRRKGLMRHSRSGLGAAALLCLVGLVAAPLASAAVTIVTQPVSQTVTPGSTCVFSVNATSTAPLAYQWSYAGNPIAGATTSRLVVTNAGTSNAGNYTCLVTDSAGGSASTWAGTLTVAASSDPGRIINLSVLTAIVPSVPARPAIKRFCSARSVRRWLLSASAPWSPIRL